MYPTAAFIETKPDCKEGTDAWQPTANPRTTQYLSETRPQLLVLGAKLLFLGLRRCCRLKRLNVSVLKLRECLHN